MSNFKSFVAAAMYYVDAAKRAEIAKEFASALRSTNVAFKPERFIEACGA